LPIYQVPKTEEEEDYSQDYKKPELKDKIFEKNVAI